MRVSCFAALRAIAVDWMMIRVTALMRASPDPPAGTIAFLHVHVEDDTEADVHGWDDMDADLM